MASTEVSERPSTCLRYIPHRFTLRAALMLMTIAALFAWWLTWLPAGTITKRQASMVQDGMTEDRVLAILGRPKGKYQLGKDAYQWHYQIHDADKPSNRGEELLDIDRTFYERGVLVVIFIKETGRVGRSLHAYRDHSYLRK